MSTGIERLSFNQITAERLGVGAVVDGCARAGIRYVGLWRHKVAEAGLGTSARLVREAGLKVSSLCRGGMFTAAGPEGRRTRADDNRRAVEEAAELGAEVLVLVCGPAPDRNLGEARRVVADALGEMVPHAQACGVRLGLEPLHPMMIGERSVVVTLAQARGLAEALDPDWLGVIVDAYHVWWDPCLETEIAALGGRISGLHVSDWLVPTPDILAGRGMMGDGLIDLRHIRSLVDRAGYRGPVEVEIFNRDVWRLPADEVFHLVRERFARHVCNP